MVHLRKGTGGAIAAVSAAIFVSAAVIVLSATVVGERLIAMQTSEAEPLRTQPTTGATINRERKTDALPIPAAKQARSEIKFVEIIGVGDASIVYRDRGGNILFQTDPRANVTIVSKNIELPEVTIRETGTTEVERVPAVRTGPSALPHGCESAFARPSPESLTRTPDRCVTQLQSLKIRNVAALH